jgi:TonB-linked SusC/RagA family outer membrane protein
MLDFITPGLNAGVAFSFNNYFLGGSNKRKSYQRYSVTKGTLNDIIYTAFGQKTSLSPEEFVLSQYRNYSIQATLNYDKVYGKHGFSALLLFNSDNFTIDKQYPNTDAANQAFPYKTNSLSSRITYAYDEKYIAEFSASYMGTENFPENNRYGFFPAASLGWIVSKEDFLVDSKFIDFLKIRASYGLVGNDNIGGQRFMFAQRYPFIASYYLGTGNNAVASLGEGRKSNPDVTWEKDKKINIGFELNMAKRVGIVFDVFKNNRNDILSSANGSLPLFLGFNGLPDLNIGKASTKGFELSIKYNNDTKKAFQFFAEAFVASAKSKIDYNGEPLQPNTNLYKTRYAIDQPFGLKAIGLFQSDAEIAASPKPVGINIKPGDIKYQDIGGPNGVPDGIIDGNDVTAIGKTNLPEWNFGLNTGVNFKAFDLSLGFQAISGVTQYLGGSRYHAFQNNGQINEMALGRWTSQTAGSATYPRLSADNNQNNYRFSSFWQQDGSFIKLRVVEIGYTFSDNLIKKIHLSHAKVFINGTNLFTIDNIKEGDAEALYGYPQIRTISGGIKVQF